VSDFQASLHSCKLGKEGHKINLVLMKFYEICEINGHNSMFYFYREYPVSNRAIQHRAASDRRVLSSWAFTILFLRP